MTKKCAEECINEEAFRCDPKCLESMVVAKTGHFEKAHRILNSIAEETYFEIKVNSPYNRR